MAGPPASARSIASLHRASAARFWARGTWAALQRPNPPSRARTSAWSGWSLASRTRQRPWTCSTISFESRSRSTSGRPARRPGRAPGRRRCTRRRCSSASRGTPRWWPAAAPAGSRASGRAASISTAPAEAGPGLPRAAPSVRMMRCSPFPAGARHGAVAVRRSGPRRIVIVERGRDRRRPEGRIGLAVDRAQLAGPPLPATPSSPLPAGALAGGSPPPAASGGRRSGGSDPLGTGAGLPAAGRSPRTFRQTIWIGS